MSDFEYQIMRTKRKSVLISVCADGTVIVRCPREATDEYIKSVVSNHADSIRRHLSKIAKAPARALLSNDDITRLKSEAQVYLTERVSHFSVIMGVRPDKVQITSAQKRWGSCIRRHGRYKVCFSYRVMLLPENLRDLIVCHELSHMLRQNHSPAFYAVLGKYMPNHHYLSRSLKELEPSLPISE